MQGLARQRGWRPTECNGAACAEEALGAGVVGESDMPGALPPPRTAASPPSSRDSPGADEGHLENPNDTLGGGLRVPGTQVSSGYRGVSWSAKLGAWLAVAWDAGARQPRTLGAFATEEDVRSLPLDEKTLNRMCCLRLEDQRMPCLRPRSPAAVVHECNFVLCEHVLSLTPWPVYALHLP